MAAARLFGVDQTTCARRSRRWSARSTLRLFDRTNTGYRITKAGTAVIPDAEAAERGALAVERLAAEQARAARGVVRLTTGDFSPS